MDQDRPFLGIADVLEHRDQMVEVVPVDRPDVIEAQLLEQRAAHRHAAGEFVGLARRVMERPRQAAGEALQDVAHA
ncbi:hypothetical protein WR25_16468 [Diploscapter pachys]|uniref:Uncharacterized protein n=1 Tax=Diploscapter pachys TaxID=2018661 RepID=A0A2A2M5A2_9BILA|nr:hypothetical protein WR25_16468 [Diploscapter pachys]